MPDNTTLDSLRNQKLLPSTIKLSCLASAPSFSQLLEDFHDWLDSRNLLCPWDHDYIDCGQSMKLSVKCVTAKTPPAQFRRLALLVADDFTGRKLMEKAVEFGKLRPYLATWCNVKDVFADSYDHRVRSVDDMLSFVGIAPCSSKQRHPSHKGGTSRQCVRNLLEISRRLAMDGFQLPLTRFVKLPQPSNDPWRQKSADDVPAQPSERRANLLIYSGAAKTVIVQQPSVDDFDTIQCAQEELTPPSTPA
ncbi:hypothetical protein DIPPA_09415 [Diplonema papillatum]|nr:hypothetical protein DIPPA_09415 [Diplonema papillatum]